MITSDDQHRINEMLYNHYFDESKLVVALASEYPDIFLRLTGKIVDSDIWSTVDPHIHAERKINAIKEYRTITGCGLKEAKDAVEARIEHLEREAKRDW